ncbi:MAG TPA: DUF2911 domain-containing protein [Planctomycetota bacterium]
MRLPLFVAAFAALCLTVPAAAQKINGMAASSQRGEARLLVMAEDRSAFSMVSVTYGQPQWKDNYTGMLDSLKGKMNRLGKDGFTTLITFSELDIGGAKIAAGSYICALHCDKDGKFGLALLDSTKAMKEKVFPGADFKPDVLAPLTFTKDGAKESAANLTMSFDTKAEDGGKGTFTIAWGKHTLTAPCQLFAK